MILKYEGINDFVKYAHDEIPQSDTGDLSLRITDDFTFSDELELKANFFHKLKGVIDKIAERQFDLILSVGNREESYCNIDINTDFFLSPGKLRRAEERCTAFIIQYDQPHLRYKLDGVESKDVLLIINHLYNDVFDYNLTQADLRREYQKEQDLIAEQEEAEGKKFKRDEKKVFKFVSTTIRYKPPIPDIKEEE